MTSAKKLVIDRIAALPDDVSLGRILQEVIYLKHNEPLATKGQVPTNEEAAQIDRMCKGFNKAALVAVTRQLGVGPFAGGGDYKGLIAARVLRETT